MILEAAIDLVSAGPAKLHGLGGSDVLLWPPHRVASSSHTIPLQ